MSHTTALHTLPQPPAGPSRMSGRTAKSSRRTRGSTGPAILLGGGAGALGSGPPAAQTSGSAMEYSRGQNLQHPTTMHTLHPHSGSASQPVSRTTSPLFPVQFSSNSPVSPAFPSPISPAFPDMQRAPSPMARLPMKTSPTTSTHHSSRPSASSSRSQQSNMSNPGASHSSLSTAASTSTLKTPQSKLDMQSTKSARTTMAASSSTDSQNSLGSSSNHGSPTPVMPSKDRSDPTSRSRETRSPTPTQRSVSSTTTVVSSRAPPAMAQGPLPTPPSSSETMEGGHPFKTSPPRNKAPAGRSKPPPAPLNFKETKRLSQDWVYLDGPEEYRVPRVSPRLPMMAPPPRAVSESHTRPGVAAPIMIPMKQSSPSPKRPSFERSSTAPPLSPSPADRSEARTQEGRPQRPGRGSLDQLRSYSSGAGPSRPRQSSFSTPPAAVLDTTRLTEATGSGGKLSLFRTGTSKVVAEKPLKGRKSEDILRPSLDGDIKDSKATSRAQHKALGVNGGVPSSLPTEERKSSGLSLKKSSGALKALFRGAGKKDRSEAPPMPDRNEQERKPSKSRRPSTAPKEEASAPFGMNGATLAPIEYEQGRRSLGVERTLYPAPPMMRTRSHGAEAGMDGSSSEDGSGASHPTLQLPTRQRLPSRDLPPLPPPSPLPSTSNEVNTSQGDGKPQLSTLAEALPVSSLPYLSPLRASFLLESSGAGPDPIASADGQGSIESTVTVGEVTSATSATASVSPVSSASTTRPSTSSTTPTAEAPFAASSSLHLLSLPDLDLDFNFDSAFDRIGGSPSTPKRSPNKTRNRASPSSPTPQRSHTVRQSPRPSPSPQITRTHSERRRSRSFDGLTSPLMWTSRLEGESFGFESAEINELFAASQNASAPAVSMPLEPSSSDDSHASGDVPTAISDEAPSAPPSSSHGRTDSYASSMNDTATPSPPQTPEDMKPHAFPDLPPVPKTQEAQLGTAPTIPLPSLPPMAEAPVTPSNPPSAALAPAAVIHDLKPIEPTQPVVRAARVNKLVLITRSVAVCHDEARTVISLARDLERALYAFRSPSSVASSVDRANIVRNDLAPVLAEINKRTYGEDEHGSKALREQCFQWIDELLFELRVEQAANERGACLEGLGSVFECGCLSEAGLQGDLVHQTRFTDAMVKCMSFVMSKLGAKGVFHNTLLFSGRFLAFAFFRVPHIGEQLVTVLPPPRGALLRFTRPALVGASLPLSAQPLYPKHLAPLCFDDSRTYTARLGTLAAEFNTEKEKDAFLFTPGNWLRRWQSDDSELFPAFYRAYHRQLAIYLAPAIEHYEQLNQPLPAAVLLRAPGYAHLATIFAKKCHSYILGSVNAVTTSSSAQSFEATETAGFRGSQKPAVLETANRRLVETLSTFANARVCVPTSAGVIECDGQQLYGGMLDLWTKSLVSKTSLYAPKGVFCLFDLLDGIVDPPLDHVTGERRLTETSLLDVPHLIHVIRLVLTQGEHALTLVKVIAFVFTHWEVLTARCEDRRELCLELLLEKDLFERLLLFWSQSVRSYILRLVVFRLGHLHTKIEDGKAHDVEIESVRVLQTRLDRIRRRHDELEPKAISEIEEEVDELYLTPLDGGSMPRSKSTITMVADSPRAVSTNKAERLLGLGFGNVEKEEEPPAKVKGKATNWFKKSFGAKKKRKGEPSTSTSASTSTEASPSLGTSPSLGPSPVFASPAMASSPESSSSSFGGSPLLGYMKKTPEMRSSPQVPQQPVSPVVDSPVSSAESSSPTTMEASTRKARPPRITTSESSPVVADPPRSPSSFAFEFELPTMSPRSDTFDPTPVPTPQSPRRNSQPPSPRQPQSPHMSRSFSKRASLLPPPTANALANESPNPRHQRLVKVEKEEKGYDKKLHAYAIRMLAELEDAQKEYDEWWSEGGIGRMDGAPPRLTVAWPFHEGED